VSRPLSGRGCQLGEPQQQDLSALEFDDLHRVAAWGRAHAFRGGTCGCRGGTQVVSCGAERATQHQVAFRTRWQAGKPQRSHRVQAGRR
jgi:hypothetical protein